MNVALTLSANGKALLVYDEPLGFQPAWVESSDDGRGIRIIGTGGQEFLAGVLHDKTLEKIKHLTTVVLVRMENRKPVETHQVPFVNQRY